MKCPISCALLLVFALGCAANSNADAEGTAGGSSAGTGPSAGGSATSTGGASSGGGGQSGGAGASNAGSVGSGGSAGSSGASSGGSGGSGGAPPDSCVQAGTCPAGVWEDVTPSDENLTDALDCGNYGDEAMQVDPNRPQDLYTMFMCQGIWKSTDYGSTWSGPISTGSQGNVIKSCAGGITMAPHDDGAEQATIYAACIRGDGLGFWRSTNSGVDFTRYTVAPGGARQDFYPPVVDPYDKNHLLMAGHEMDMLVESSDGGQNWASVSIDAGMNENGGTAAIFFIDTGSADTTAKTWLWLAQQSDIYGTWRTTDGASWTKVDKNEHPHGISQAYQPGTDGVYYMAGAYSLLGWGVLRSSDYGATWAHVGEASNEAVVFGTTKHVYAMQSGASGIGDVYDPNFQAADQPGTGTWTKPGTPTEMTQGPAQLVVTSDGEHEIIVSANWSAGLWRYIEP